MTSVQEWENFFKNAGIDDSASTDYAALFVKNKIEIHQITTIFQSDLRALGIDALGDVRKIKIHMLKEAKKLMLPDVDKDILNGLNNEPVDTSVLFSMIKSLSDTVKSQSGEVDSKFDSLIDRYDKDLNKLQEISSLFLVRNVSQLLLQKVGKIHSEDQFYQILLLPNQKGKKKNSKLVREEHLKFIQCSTQLKKIDEKISAPRNLLGHPIKKLDEITLTNLTTHLERMKTTKYISDDEKKVIEALAQYYMPA